MTSLPKLSLLAMAACAAFAALGTAQAQTASDPYYYLGGGIGQSRGAINENRVTSGLIPPGLAVSSIQSNEIDITYKVFGGYQFNRYIALEGGFFSLGSFDFTSTTTPAGKLQGETKLQGLNLDLVGTLPISDRFSALARIGGQYARTRGEYTASGAAGSFRDTPSKREGNLKVGLGLQYAFSPSLLMRGEVERYRVSDAMGGHDNVNAFTLSAVFPFGRAPQAARTAYVAPAASVAPAPVAAAPAPAPVVVAVAPVVVVPVERRRVSFSADSLFGFDQSAMRPDGKAALDTFARELQGTQYDSITVEGHTDRLGTTAYNQTLSQQRADAVKAYLVSSSGIAAAKITAVGKSESAPETKPGDCKGNQATPKLIACLQPDRRVDVEVTGTR
jgi:OOP family OmpA-OmpF porin